MTLFDEETWKDTTSWQAAPPTPADVWALLSAGNVSARVSTAVSSLVGGSAALEAALAQWLAAQGLPRSDLEERFRTVTGRNARPTTIDSRLRTRLAKARQWNIRFANLVSGRFTELVFERAYRDLLASVGVDLIDETSARSFLDFLLVSSDAGEGFAVSVNVKNAGRQMEKAQEFFGLDPADTLPIATYKAFGSIAAGIPPLLYVFLVDWDLLEKLRAAYWTNGINDDERSVFRLLTTFSGFPRALEDTFIAATVEDRLAALRGEVGYSTLEGLQFRAVSAARCHSIFFLNHQRSPYVYIKRMQTDPNVHISVRDETLAFEDLVSTHLATPALRADFLRGLARTTTRQVPDPPV